MPVNASVWVKDGNIDKALGILERKLKKEGLWKYNPETRRNPKETKKKRDKGKLT